MNPQDHQNSPGLGKIFLFLEIKFERKKLWIRKVSLELKLDSPVQKLVIDNLLNITTPFYEHESKLLFI